METLDVEQWGGERGGYAYMGKMGIFKMGKL
jgi:hypothetical protein